MILVFSVRCDAGHKLSAEEFSFGKRKTYPVPCTEQIVRAPLQHPGCGAALLIEEAV